MRSRLAACISVRCDRSVVLEAISEDALVTSRVAVTIEAMVCSSWSGGLVEVVLDLLIVLRQPLVEAHGEVAGRQPLQAARQDLDDLGLRRGVGAALGRFPLPLGGIALLLLRHLVELALGFFRGSRLGLDLERLDGAGDLADLVLAAHAGQHDVEIAVSHVLHAGRQLAQRTNERIGRAERQQEPRQHGGGRQDHQVGVQRFDRGVGIGPEAEAIGRCALDQALEGGADGTALGDDDLRYRKLAQAGGRRLQIGHAHPEPIVAAVEDGLDGCAGLVDRSHPLLDDGHVRPELLHRLLDRGNPL